MSASTQKLPRIGARAGVLVGLIAVVAAIAAVSASSASAFTWTVGKCAGSSLIEAQGSSLQNTAQTIWGETGNKFDTNTAAGCGATGLSKPKVKYKKTSSLIGLEAWGVKSGTGFKKENLFIGTDEAPSGSATTGQIKNIVTASGGSGLLSIPVTQAAVAVIANPPANCSITKITNAQIEKAFVGAGATTAKAVNWKEIGGEGTGCEGAEVKRVVRADGSGTTYQFKHYLNLLQVAASTEEPNALNLGPTSLPCIGGKWNEWQEEVTKNITWPANTGTCTSPKLSELIHSFKNGEKTAGAGEGGGDEVKTVNNTDGSIGYAALADAKGNATSGTTFILEVQNNGTTSPANYVSPATATGENSNCEGIAYSGVPAGTANADWSKAYGENPKMQSASAGKYSICTVTFDEALTEYSKPGNTEPEARDVFDYLNYVINSSGGQTDQSGKWYSPLPSTIQTKAQTAVNAIGF
jgi:ABC-type phosphate transport system substrate-binding protein